jgi:o-succinylbenzoate synthase
MASVKICRAILSPYRLPLVRGLSTARGEVQGRRGWLLELQTDSGEVGRGDACPYPGDEEPALVGDGFGMESWPACGERLEVLAAGLMGRGLSEAQAFLDSPEGSAPDAPAARFALDCAVSELAARSRACSVATWLAESQGRKPRARLAVSALVSGGCEEAIVGEAAALQRAGFRTFKLKLGGRPLDEDLARVKALREALGPEAKLRLDANAAFSLGDASALLAALEGLDIELVEQPVAAGDVEGLARVRAESPVPIAADEALVDRAAAERIIETHAADVLVLKPAALGGLRRAQALAAEAARAGMAFYVTSLLDSAYGVAAATHLAAALPGSALAHGLATAALFSFDLARAPLPDGGWLSLPTAPGWGLEADSAATDRARAGAAIEVGA